MTSSIDFSDITSAGASFDVRKVKVSALPSEVRNNVAQDCHYAAVKHPRASSGIALKQTFDEVATELNILAHHGIQKHPNIIDFYALMWHNAATPELPQILPALVLEFAQYGTLLSYQARGYCHDIASKYDVCNDVAQGLLYIHQCEILHGDVKSSNVLICWHPTRSFVAKLSDFGFSMSTADLRRQPIGYTRYLEAPECSKILNPDFLFQLDIYSYGLLVHSVLKNGAAYYQVELDQGQPELIGTLKSTNILPSILQMNLLTTMNEDRCLLLIFCKILAYCLRAEPSERFPNMDMILSHLKWANPRDLDISLHTGEDLYKTFRWQVAFYDSSRDKLLTAFSSTLEKHFDAIKSKVPLAEFLKDAYAARMIKETDMIMSKPKPGERRHYDCCPGLDLVLWRFIIGVSELPSPGEAAAERVSPEQSW